MLLLTATYAILNRLRGSDFGKPYTSKGVTSFICGLATGGYALCMSYGVWPSIIIGCFAFLGILLWAIPGWGQGFDAITGQDHHTEHDWFPMDWFDGVENNYLRGTLQMSMRGLAIVPLFVALSFAAWKYSFILGLSGLLQGPVYYLAGIPQRMTGKNIGVPIAETLWGATMGFFVWLALRL